MEELERHSYENFEHDQAPTSNFQERNQKSNSINVEDEFTIQKSKRSMFDMEHENAEERLGPSGLIQKKRDQQDDSNMRSRHTTLDPMSSISNS